MGLVSKEPKGYYLYPMKNNKDTSKTEVIQ